MDNIIPIDKYLTDNDMDSVKTDLKKVVEFVMYQEEEIKELREIVRVQAGAVYSLRQEVKALRKI